ncbi:MAG: ATP-binding cassette domain-containing protein [Paracoccus sp. (in: a-proteobacteria)]|uniref:ATP-binding cassette domain-containing protein n=1 Tax=Paracoccus sp. TaxID=267 RepID=UPI00391C1A00
MPEPDPQAGGLLRLAHVSKRFGGVQALDDIAFDVRPGEVLCLAGENGCGKFTLIKVISGVHRPEPGAVIEWQGRARKPRPPRPFWNCAG